jgi:uncharacterized protein HemY
MTAFLFGAAVGMVVAFLIFWPIIRIALLMDDIGEWPSWKEAKRIHLWRKGLRHDC